MSMALRAFVVLLSILECAVAAVAAAEPIFYESFEEDWVGRWHPSSKEEYQGVWKHAKSEGHDNHGLLASEKARKYGIATLLPQVVEFKDEPILLQYDLRLQNGIECGGSYLKFLQVQKDGWTPTQLDNEAPYSIMFGPDKCGSTNKVHFIFRHKHPKTGAYIEHHLKFPPSLINDKLSHVYTAALYPNNTVSILIDGQVKKSADLLSDNFDPPVLPPKMIPDPEDTKPEDWDERAKVPDPEAVKPEDWDEDAPYETEDMDATKPEGWLDDEPEEIDDVDAVKPEDWDDDEDGEWEVPKVSNPKCVDGPGCGNWTRPKKKNPAFKGKWYAPMIENPAYKGTWKAQEIPNPDYFHLEKPNLEPISAVSIEIWTMQDGILFDNVLITSNEDLAAEYRDMEWKVKFNVEKMQQKKEEAEEAAKKSLFVKVQDMVFKTLYHIAELPMLASQKDKLVEFIERGEENPVAVLGIFGGVVPFGLILIFWFLFMRKRSKISKKASLAKAKKDDITPDDDIKSSEKSRDKEKGKEKVTEENAVAEEVFATRHRRPRRET
ncbi:hypothetical protein GOP47_0015949 [Adiantum capillus-veneris]|uniref:Calnexin n=1 Tax=Adiantum capillus-veneris TaxID=13818 RepID=A0A9D4ULS4_ADICA|nr:hypothetical protein GOP47_0015949 [Adiantum capillus-veneris]